MLQTDLSKPETLGADLRALRKSRGLTLSDMAESLGRSVGWLSQVERDLSDPSISDLREIAALLGVPDFNVIPARGCPRARGGLRCAPWFTPSNGIAYRWLGRRTVVTRPDGRFRNGAFYL